MGHCLPKGNFEWEIDTWKWSWKAGVYKVLSDRKLLGTVTMAKQFNRDIVLEFYVNLKSDISIAQSSNFHKVTVRWYDFDFSPKIISDYLNCKKVKS